MNTLGSNRQQALLTSVMNVTDVMLVYLDPDFNFVWVNQAYANTCLMTPEEMVGKNHFELYPDAENEAIFRHVRDSGESVFYKDKPFEFPDQPERGITYWDWSLAPDKGADGQKVQGLVFSLRETTNHVRAQQAVRASELRYRSLFDHTLVGISHCRMKFENGRPVDFLHLDVNPAFARLTGLTDAIGKNVSELIPNLRETNQELFEIYGRVVTQQRPETLETYVPGLASWYSISVYPAEPDCFVVVFDNISERKAAEQELRDAKTEADISNKAKSRFLASVSHDLRQPLSALSLYVDALANRPAIKDDPLFNKIEHCISSLNESLSGLLDLSKLEAGVVIPNIADFTLDTLLTRVIASHAPEAARKGLELRQRPCSAVGRTDPVLYQRIIGNLVSNAVRYTHRGGVLIGCRRRGGKVWVEVWDTGIGIPEGKTEEIFEEFRQLENAERNPAKGAGLGLAIAARNAALLGLQIRVSSILGKGSLFAVELPLGNLAVSPEQRPRHAPTLVRIALVEDNAEVAEALSFTLGGLGNDVVMATSRAELIPQLDDLPPDIVISDFRLAGNENGVDVVQALRREFGEALPAIIITGDTDPAIVSRLAEQHICILHKPLNLDSLRQKIAELVA